MGTDKIIEETSFDNQKEELKSFSEQTSLNPEFDTYKTSDGLFGWFDHSITGNEMNEFVRKLQAYIADSNGIIKKLIQEFGEVYETFDSLDNEYIKGILLSIEATEKVSEDNAKTILALQKTVDKLKELKKENEKYHKYIDGIGEELEALYAFNKKADEYETKLKETGKKNQKLTTLLYISSAIGGAALVFSIVSLVLSIVL